jgi:integrase
MSPDRKNISQIVQPQDRFKSLSAGLKYNVEKIQKQFNNNCSLIDRNIIYDRSLSPHNECEVIQFIIQQYGIRISELLQSETSDIVNYCDLIIRGNKGSASRFLHLPELSDFFAWRLSLPPGKIFYTRYITFYRYCLAHGYFEQHKGKVNRSVTHSFRYKYIRSLSDVAGDIKTVADCVGHRSKKTSQEYLNKEKKNE